MRDTEESSDAVIYKYGRVNNTILGNNFRSQEQTVRAATFVNCFKWPRQEGRRGRGRKDI